MEEIVLYEKSKSVYEKAINEVAIQLTGQGLDVISDWDSCLEVIKVLEEGMFGMPGREEQDKVDFLTAYNEIMECSKSIPTLDELQDKIEVHSHDLFEEINNLVILSDIHKEQDDYIDEHINHSDEVLGFDEAASGIREYVLESEFYCGTYSEYITCERFSAGYGKGFSFKGHICEIATREGYEVDLGSESEGYPLFVETVGFGQNILLPELIDSGIPKFKRKNVDATRAYLSKMKKR